MAAGNYTVTVTDASSCVTVENFSISEPDAFTVSFANENEHCDSKDGQLVATATGGSPSYTFLWNDGTNGNVLLNQNAGNLVLRLQIKTTVQFKHLQAFKILTLRVFQMWRLQM